MTLIQLVLITFALFVITRVVKEFKRGGLTLAMLIFWLTFWISVGTVSVLPQTTDVVARFVGVGRGADLIVYLSVIGLFFLVFKMFAKVETVEQEMTRLVRVSAIKEAEEQQKTHVA